MSKDIKYTPEKQFLKVNVRVLPELEKINVGDTVTITLKAKLISKSQGDEYLGDNSYVEKEFGKAYADAKEKEDALTRGKFEVLSADENGEDDFEKGLNSDGYKTK